MTKFLIFFSLLGSFFGTGQNIWMTPNLGQWDARIDYSVDLAQGKLYLEGDGLCYYFTDALSHNHEHHKEHHDEAEEPNRYHAIKQSFIGSNATNHTSNHKSEYYQNFVLGNNPQKWKSMVYSFNEVTYTEFYSGIDLIYKGLEGQLSYIFKVQPGAEVNHILFRFDGAEKVTLKDGDLSIHHSFGEILQSKPLAWEIDENGRKKKVNIAFHLEQDIVSFVFPDGYDTDNELYIDPSLTFSTFTGGTSDNWGFTATPDIYGIYLVEVSFLDPTILLPQGLLMRHLIIPVMRACLMLV